MKKYLKTSLILFIALFGVKVKADMGAPDVPALNFYVSNPEGTYKYKIDYNNNLDKMEYLKTNELLNYNEQIDLICYEYNEEYCQSNDWDNIFYIKISDITVIKEKFTKEEGTKLQEKKYAKVFNKNGVALYNGPSTTFYKKIATIPYGAKFSYEYMDAKDEYSSAQWVYTTYGDLSGWVYLGMPYTGKSQIAISDTKSSFMVINNNYFMINELSDVADLYGLGVSGYENEIASKRVNITIPYGTILTSTYVYNPAPKIRFYLVKYKGKEYWLRTQGYYDDGVATPSPAEYVIEVGADKDIYDNLNDKNVIGHILSGTKVKELYSHYSSPGEPYQLYIEHNNVKGWIEILVGENANHWDENGNIFTIDEENPEDVEEKIKEELSKKEAKKEEKKENKKKTETKKTEVKNNKNVIIYCVFGAIALAITALTIIILKNKKQKKSVIKIENEKSIENIEEKESEIKSNGISESEYNKEDNIENKDEKKL